MKKRNLLGTLLLAGLLLTACASPAAEAEVEETVAAEPVLTLSGAADASWTAEDLQAKTMVEAEYTNKDGETTVYTGVALLDLLSEAGVAEYASISLVSDDGYSADVTSEELSACSTCVVVLTDDGSLRSVLPEFSSKVQVKGLVEIIVQ